MFLLFTILKLHTSMNQIIKKEDTFHDSGSIEDSVTYVFENGILTIKGEFFIGIRVESMQPWFSYRSQIKTLIIEESITTIGEKTFYNLNELTSITLPKTVTYFEPCAFGNCSKLSSIIIPEDNEKYTVKDGVVYSKNMDIIVFVPMLRSIDYVIPKEVYRIDIYAFYFCQNKSITIPETITEISYNAFSNSYGTITIDIPNSVTVIGSNAFDEFQTLETVYIGNGVTKLHEDVFGNCQKLKTVIFKEKCQINLISTGTFYNCLSLSTIEIPDSITRISDFAFDNCKSLETIDIPSNVISIGERTFKNCSNLVSITFHDGLNSIDTEAFNLCDNLKFIDLPDTVSYLGSFAFSDTGVISVRFSRNLTYISSSIFYHCSELVSIIIPNNITKIYDSAFRHCSSLKYVFIADTVTEIESYAFDTNSRVAIIFYAGTYEPILGDSSFDSHYKIKVPIEYNSSSLDKITVNKTLKYNELTDKIVWIFDTLNCNLTILGFGEIPDYSSPSETPWISYITSIKTVYIDVGITSIGNNSFSSCINLQSLKFGNYVKRIGSFAFHNCANLRGLLELPKTVTSIEDSAFAGTNLENITFYGENEPNCHNAFNLIGSKPSSSLIATVIDNYTGTSLCGIQLNKGNDDVSNSEESILPTPTVIPTPAPIPEIIFELENLPENANEAVFNEKLKETFNLYSDLKDMNLIAIVKLAKIEFNSQLNKNQFIKPVSKSTIHFNGGNLNLILPDFDASTEIFLNEEERTNLLIKGKGDVTLIVPQDTKKKIHINNTMMINGEINIKVSNQIESFEVDSINFDSNSVISVKKINEDQQKLDLKVHNITANYYSNGILTDFTILDSITIYQTALLNFQNVDCETAKIELKMRTFSKVQTGPFLKGVFKNPPSLINVSKNLSFNGSPEKNEEYVIVSGLFDENKCIEWLDKVELGDYGFNSKNCVDNSDLLANQENQRIVIKSVQDQPKDKNKLTKTQIIGIAVGCAAGVIVIVVIIVVVVICVKKKSKVNASSGNEP